MPNQIISERMNLFIPEYKSYLLSGAPGEIASVFSEPHSFTPEQTIVLENGFVLYLLFFINLDELAEYIGTECGLGTKESHLLAAGMHNALPEEVQQLVAISQAEIAKENSPDIELSNEFEEDLAEIEKNLSQVQSVRTMQSDSRNIGYSSVEETTHSSDQSNLLQK